MSIVRSPIGRGLAALSIVFGLTVAVVVADQKKDEIQSCPASNYPTAPPGSTALCNDGSFSSSKNRAGTCSSSGGVKCWLCPGAMCSGKPQQQDAFDPAQRMDITTLVQMADGALTGTPAGGEINWTWENNYLKAQDGKTYVPFTLQFDSITGPTPVTMYIRVVSAGTKVPIPPAPPTAKDDKKKDKDKDKAEPAPAAYPYEDVHFLEVRPEPGKPARISRAFAVAPGEYDVYVAVKERGAAPASSGNKDAKNAPAAPAGKTGIAKQTVTVPNYWTNEFTTSTLIVADRVDVLKEPLTPQQQMERPYAMGSTEIVPAFDMKFTKAELLSVIFLVYNPTLAAGKPDITIEYTFHHKAPEGEKRFNSTDPQNFNAQTLPPTFDLAAGHQLVAGQEIPLATFPLGDFRLEIKITDKVSGKSLVRNLSFSVAAS